MDALGVVVDVFDDEVPETWDVYNCLCAVDARKLEAWNWEIAAARILVGLFQTEREENVYTAASEGVTVRVLVVVGSCGLEMEKEETERT